MSAYRDWRREDCARDEIQSLMSRWTCDRGEALAQVEMEGDLYCPGCLDDAREEVLRWLEEGRS
jgi:hypothetical protein